MSVRKAAEKKIQASERMQVKTLGYCLLLGAFFVLVYFAFLRGDSAAEEEREHALRQLQIQVEQIPALREDLEKLQRQHAALQKVVERGDKEWKERDADLKELERTAATKQKDLLSQIEALKRETTDRVNGAEDRMLKDAEELLVKRLKDHEAKEDPNSEKELLLKIQTLELALELSNQKLGEYGRKLSQLPDSYAVEKSVYSSTEAVLSSRLPALKKDLVTLLNEQVALHTAKQAG